MKYIDAEKLIAEIERRIESWAIRGKHSPAGQGRDTCDSRVTELSDLLSFIRSLQKEQPDKYETALEKAREWMPNVNQGGHAILIDIFPELGDGLDPSYGGRKQGQPEVDIEKEIDEHAINMPHGEFTHDSECEEHEEWAKREFRHFYELGCKQSENIGQLSKIKGWVARDENGELWFHHLEPMRDGGKWNFGGGGFKMVEDIYPALSWHDEPIEVELTISWVIK